jgi:CheY-like chemotaxis protein
VSLQDTGAGLSAAKLEQLFQPFNRLGQEAGAQEGTGIGLVVSKRLVELMGGSIGVHSTVGVGSTFWIELPTCALQLPIDEPTELASARPVRLADGAPRRTLLCVEDNPANLLLVQRLLERRPDIHLLSARDGRQGVELARACRPDLVLMDINLPGISGLTALRILADDPATRHIPVIALSANAMPHDVAKGLQAGFFRYLTKPIKVPEFMATLDLALALTSRPVALASRPLALTSRPGALTSRPGALTSRPGGDAAPTEPEHRREFSGRVNAGQRHAAGKPI